METRNVRGISSLSTGRRVVVVLAAVFALSLFALAGPALASSSPAIESESVSDITPTGATLEATINPDGGETEYEIWFWPGCSGGFCERAPPEVVATGHIGAGFGDHAVNTELNDLQPGEPNNGYWVVARNAYGTTEGAHQTFTTPSAGAKPVIDSVSVSHLTPTDATLEAQIDTEGLSTIYEFQMWSSPCSKHGAGCELIEEIPLPSGLLLGSFVDQSVSLDLNSAGVTLGGGEYGFSVRAANAAGSTGADGGSFEAPPRVIDPPSSGGSLHGTSSGGGQSTESRDSSAASASVATIAGDQIGGTLKLKPLTKAQKLAKALKACQKKPKKHRASCEKLALKKYGVAAKRKR